MGGKNGITVGLPPVLLYGRFSVMIVMRGTTRAVPAARTTWISLPSHSSTADVRESLRPPPVGGTVRLHLDGVWHCNDHCTRTSELLQRMIYFVTGGSYIVAADGRTSAVVFV